MSPHRLYSYPRCSTCRKALAWLAERQCTPGQGLDLIDITVHPPSPEELREALRQCGRSRLFNTSGQSYRALGAAQVRSWSDSEALDALARDGRLIKRPFLVSASGTVLTGFRPEEWERHLS